MRAKRTTGTRSSGSIAPGQFEAFDVSVGPLPTDVDHLVFKALQTYADGQVVRWIDEPVTGSAAEPDHPAPVVTLSAEGTTEPATSATAAKTTGTSDSSTKTLAIVGIVLGALALAVALASIGRGRRPSR